MTDQPQRIIDSNHQVWELYGCYPIEEGEQTAKFVFKRVPKPEPKEFEEINDKIKILGNALIGSDNVNYDLRQFARAILAECERRFVRK